MRNGDPVTEGRCQERRGSCRVLHKSEQKTMREDIDEMKISLDKKATKDEVRSMRGLMVTTLALIVIQFVSVVGYMIFK